MLPISLRVVYALNAATFQVSSLALLSIVNTRVAIPAEYLPAYGAISFLPYSLRPIFAWVSSLLLLKKKKATEDKNRHDKLLFPSFLLACLAFVGTTFIPSGGIILCFVFGFARGIAGAWGDFLIGMSVIEFSRLQGKFLPDLSRGDGNTTYEHIVSVNTAQSSTAKNLGSFVASIATYLFFSHNKDLGEKVANKLLLGTAAIFLLGSLASLKYQFHVSKMLANFNRYDTIDDHDEELPGAAPSELSSGRGEFELTRSDSEGGTPSPADTPVSEDVPETKGPHWQQIIEVSTLVSFQTLLAVSALQKPIIAISNRTTWLSMVVILAIILAFTIYIGYQYEQQKNTTLLTSDNQDGKVPPRQLSLYFLLRYSMPIAGFMLYSYFYTVFESEPEFLQLLSVMNAAIGSLSTFVYEKFLSPHCHSGWPLIGLIASLDIVVGLVALLDVWVIRAVKGKEIDGEYIIDTQLRCLVAAVGLAKYFFAELDYMPALVLSTTNVRSDDDVCSENGNCSERYVSKADGDISGHTGETTSLPDDFDSPVPPSLNKIATPQRKGKKTQRLPVISAGMQYASFLSCIDFGAQIGDWITVPIIASLDITRENHWDHLDRFVILCSILRMARVVFLWLICPPIHSHNAVA